MRRTVRQVSYVPSVHTEGVQRYVYWFAFLSFVISLGLLLGSVTAAFPTNKVLDVSTLAGVAFSLGVLIFITWRDLSFSYVTLGVIFVLGLSLRYLPYFATGHLYGGTDAVYTYSALSSFFASGAFVPDTLTPTHAFPGLFHLYQFLYLQTGLTHEQLAMWIHPLINALSVLVIFAFAAKVWNLRVAVLAAALFGLDIVVIRLGGELRQEAVGILFYALVYWSLLRNRTSTVATTVVKLLLIASTVITHFVTSANLIALLLVYTVAELWLELTTEDKRKTSSVTTLAVVLILLISFIFYLADTTADRLIITAANIITELLQAEFTSVGQELAFDHYGLLVTVATWLFRAVLVAASTGCFVTFFKTKRPAYFLISVLSGLYAVLAVVSSVAPLGLNSFRFYHLLAVSGSLVIAVAFSKLYDNRARWVIPAFVSVFTALYTISSIQRFPTEIMPALASTRPTSGVDAIEQRYLAQDFSASRMTHYIKDSTCLVGNAHSALVFRGLGRHEKVFEGELPSGACSNVLYTSVPGTDAPATVYDNGVSTLTW